MIAARDLTSMLNLSIILCLTTSAVGMTRVKVKVYIEPSSLECGVLIN